MSISDDVLHAIGLGVRQLRGEVAEQADIIDRRDAEIRQLASNAAVNRKTMDEARERSLRMQQRLDQYVEREPRARKNLDDLDRITLQLAEYIEELDRHASAVKAQSVKAALGEVAMRLRVIRKPSTGDES